MALPMNTGYNDNQSPYGGLFKAASALGRSLPSKKAIDVNRFSGVASTVQQAAGQSSGPSSYKLGTVTTPYGGSTRYEQMHPGVDIANSEGTAIPSFTPGTVKSVTTGKKQGDKGYGNSVEVVDDKGYTHRYSHLAQAYVTVGSKVGKDQPIGVMGNTGSTYSPSGTGTGTHLDYRVVDAYNKYVNPTPFLVGE